MKRTNFTSLLGFLWLSRTWDHHDILNVAAEYNGTNKDCSTSAVLTSVAPFTGRKTTAVHAKDSSTGQILRCEVFIDKIYRIQIFHHSLKLDLDGMATLRIRAFDTEGMGSSFAKVHVSVPLILEATSKHNDRCCVQHCGGSDKYKVL